MEDEAAKLWFTWTVTILNVLLRRWLEVLNEKRIPRVGIQSEKNIYESFSVGHCK